MLKLQMHFEFMNQLDEQPANASYVDMFDLLGKMVLLQEAMMNSPI